VLRTRISSKLFTTLLMTTAFTVPAFAQVEVVVVTAEKKAEDLQTVPIAVTAISGDTLKQKQIDTFKDLQYNVPNLTFTKTGLGNGTVSIRGISQAAGDPGVAQYVDGVYSETADLATGQYYDLSSVEVLRGPQGTLYGRGSVGGTINLISAKPDLDNFGANGEITYGEYNTINSDAMVNIPLIDGVLGARFAGQFSSHDGYTKNIGEGGDYNGLNDYSVRGSLRWQPTSNTTFDFTGSYSNEADTRTRGDNTECSRDPSGVMGCLPDGLGLESPNIYATSTDQFASKQFFGTIGQLVGGQFLAPAVYGTANGAALAGGLAALHGLTLAQAAQAQALNASGTAANLPFYQLLMAQGYGNLASNAALIDLGVQNGVGSGAAVQSRIPQNIATINSPQPSQFDEVEQNYSLHWHQHASDWLDVDAIVGHRESHRTTLASYNDQPEEDIGSAINTAIPAFETLVGSGLIPGDTGRLAALQAMYPQTFAPAAGTAPLLPWSNPIPGGIANTATGIANYSSLAQFRDREANESHENSGEVRFSTSFDGPLNFTMGGFYWERNTNIADYRVAFTGGDYAALFLGQTIGSFLPSGGQALVGQDPMYYQNAPGNSTSEAAFMDATYVVIPDLLTFKAGIRWGQDKDSLTNNVASFVSLNSGATSSSCLLSAFCFLPASNNAAGTIAAAQGNYVPAPATSKTTSLIDYRAVVEYTPKLDFTDATFIYASWSRGSKPGNLNLVSATTVGAIPPSFLPEELDSAEIGLKNTLLDGTLQANLTGWYYDYKNFQFTSTAFSTLFTQNLNAHMWGGEAELVWQPDEHWQFNLQLTDSGSAIGNSFAVDFRNPIAGHANGVYIKDDALGGGQNGGSDFPGNSCAIASNTGISPADDPAVTAAFAALGQANPFKAPPGGATQLAGHGVALVNYGNCTTNFAALGLGSSYHYVSAADGKGDSLLGFGKSLKGNDVPRLPENTVNIGAQYTWEIDGGYTLVPRADYFWQSGFNSSVFDDAVDQVSSWDQLNLSLQLTNADQGWFAKVFATNVMDSRNIQGKELASDTSGLYTTVFLEDPRIIGVTLGAHF
jgi:iron complex outermembrane recepter protein